MNPLDFFTFLSVNLKKFMEPFRLLSRKAQRGLKRTKETKGFTTLAGDLEKLEMILPHLETQSAVFICGIFFPREIAAVLFGILFSQVVSRNTEKDGLKKFV